MRGDNDVYFNIVGPRAMSRPIRKKNLQIAIAILKVILIKNV